MLFEAGRRRGPIYRIERGAFCHYLRWPKGKPEIIEHAFAGDIIGFGHLAEHVSTAQALVDSEVSVVTVPEFERAVAEDAQLASRVAALADAEFDHARACAIEKQQKSPVQHVASYIVAVHAIQSSSGCAPELLRDDLISAYTAERLHMTGADIRDALRQLHKSGLIAQSPGGWRVVDARALERFADAPHVVRNVEHWDSGGF